MKYVKIFALALGALTLTACSNDDDYNTASNVTVEMAQSEIEFRENAGVSNPVYVPIQITGDANGPVKVTVKVEGSGSNPALPYEDRNGEWSGNYLVTSTTITIPADEKRASVEIKTFDDIEENDDRTFTITIETAEGATIGNPSSTIVTLLDNDKGSAYDKLTGSWNFNFTNSDGQAESTPITISALEPGEEGYGTELLLEGLLNNPTIVTLYYYSDNDGNPYVEFILPEPIIGYDADNYIWAMVSQISESGGVSVATRPTAIRGEVSEDLRTITFNPSDMIGFIVAAKDLSALVGIYELADGITITR